MERYDEFVKDAEKYLGTIHDESVAIMEAIETYDEDDEGTYPDDEEIAQYFEDGYFDTVAWINDNCLEANTGDLLLCTGGPTYGVVNIQGGAHFWYQDWFTEKWVKYLSGKAQDFYQMIFETLDELS